MNEGQRKGFRTGRATGYLVSWDRCQETGAVRLGARRPGSGSRVAAYSRQPANLGSGFSGAPASRRVTGSLLPMGGANGACRAAGRLEGTGLQSTAAAPGAAAGTRQGLGEGDPGRGQRRLSIAEEAGALVDSATASGLASKQRPASGVA